MLDCSNDWSSLLLELLGRCIVMCGANFNLVFFAAVVVAAVAAANGSMAGE